MSNPLVDEDLVKSVLRSLGHSEVSPEAMEEIVRLAAHRTQELQAGEDDDEEDEEEEDDDDDDDQDTDVAADKELAEESAEDLEEENDTEANADDEEEDDEMDEKEEEDEVYYSSSHQVAAPSQRPLSAHGRIPPPGPTNRPSTGQIYRSQQQQQQIHEQEYQHLQQFAPFEDMMTQLQKNATSAGDPARPISARQARQDQAHLPLHMRTTMSSSLKQNLQNNNSSATLNNTTAIHNREKENFPVLTKAEKQQLKHELFLKTGRRGRQDTPLVLARKSMLPSKRYADPVALGAKTRQQWAHDSFLAQKGRKEECWKVRMSMLQ